MFPPTVGAFMTNGASTLSDTETNKETDKKNGLYRIVWKCSYCTKTDANTYSHWVLCLFITARKRGSGQGIFLYLSSFCSWGGGVCVYPSKQWTGVYPSMQWGWGCLPRGGVCLGGCLSKGVSASYWNAFLSVSMSVSVSGSVNVPLFLPATCSKSSKGIIPTCGFSVVKG